jgi:hypothetical protein
MIDEKMVNAELRNIQKYFEAKMDMTIGNGKLKTACWARTCRDALELLKAQHPRVLTLDEIEDGKPYWLGTGKEFVTRPVICVHREDDAQKSYITFVWQFGTFSWASEDYGKTWRCWSARPTNAEKREVAWDGTVD